MTKTLLITGASSGIGAATARAATEAGWNVSLLARSADALDELAGEIGPATLAIPCDVTDRTAIDAAVTQTIDHFGRLDAVHANAGTGVDTPGIAGGDPDEWHDMIHLNIMAVLYTAHATLPELQKRQGTFVLTGSKAGRDHLKGSVYGATKWFVQGLAGNLAQEMHEWGGRCAVITPGMVDTPFFDEPKEDALQAEDVADAVIFALEQPATAAVHEIHLMPAR